MCDIPRIAQEARDRGLVFPLTYHTDDGPRVIDAFMARHRDPINGDDFTAHDAEDGRVLGAGDTKQEARQEARIRLLQHFHFGIPLPKVPGEGGG